VRRGAAFSWVAAKSLKKREAARSAVKETDERIQLERLKKYARSLPLSRSSKRGRKRRADWRSADEFGPKFLGGRSTGDAAWCALQGESRGKMAEQISVVLVHGLQGNGARSSLMDLRSREFSARYRLAIFWATAGPRWRSSSFVSLHRMLAPQPFAGYNGARSKNFKVKRFAGLKNLLHADFVERQRRKGFLLLSLIFFSPRPTATSPLKTSA